MPVQIAHMLLLAVVTGNGPGYYNSGRFYRRSVPLRDILRHLDSRGYKKRVDELNHPDYHKLSQHKLAEKGLLKLLGFPVTRFIAYFHPRSGRSATGQPVTTAQELEQLLLEDSADRICFKQPEGWAGHGFRAADVVRSANSVKLQMMGATGASCSVEELLQTGIGNHGVLIEEFLEQHPALSKIYPSSVNTYRVWVKVGTDGVSRPLMGFFRLGRSGSIVDNQSSGGILSLIDIDSGVVGTATDGMPDHEDFDCHPDTGEQITGFALPFWEEAKATACAAVAAFPKLRFAGVDIAIAASGPYVIELNVSPDREGAALMRIPSRNFMED
ncbi:MAG: hypothetical protein HKN49_05970 [Gammaproteobacteria bacterium]|nr:hypothetical protein [Gammaproteobacteria bacterium]